MQVLRNERQKAASPALYISCRSRYNKNITKMKVEYWDAIWTF